MLSPPPRTNRFTPSCFSCRRGRGLPLGVSTCRGQRTLTYRCDNCGREWLEAVPIPSLSPKRAPRASARVLGFDRTAPPQNGAPGTRPDREE